MKHVMWSIAVLVVVLLAGCDWLTQRPYVELHPGRDIVSLGGEWTDAGCDLVLREDTIAMTPKNDVDTTSIGDTTVIYETTVEDTTYRCLRIVKVQDDTPPVLTLRPGIDTIAVGEVHVDAGVDVSDNHDPSPDLSIEQTVDTTTPGRYEIVYTATDASGNTTRVVRIVTVRD